MGRDLVKRVFDLALALPGLALLSPLMVVIAVWVRLDSAGPSLFRQVRVGRGGRPFEILKFRTMKMDQSAGATSVTVSGDTRITRLGRVLRRSKLDELPQLINVVAGEMSLVGPRPEVPVYMDRYEPAQREIILSVRPGITDYAAIALRNEEDILAGYDDPAAAYEQIIMPVKFEHYRRYVETRSLRVDLGLILQTLALLLRR